MKRYNSLVRRGVSALFASLFLTMLFACTSFAQTTAFTYQGRFSDTSTNPPTINGSYTMTFNLYDTDGTQSAGNLIGTQSAMVSVVNGIFSVKLDFGAAAFNTTSARYLEIQVGSVTLTPRQQITSTPFSQRSLNAANADSLGGVAANQYLTTTNANSNFIKNTTTQQPADFNISGSGTVGGTLASGKVTVNGGVLARGGTPGGGGSNGYAFSGNGGDDDSGMFSTADGVLQLYANSEERIRLTRGIDLTAGNGIGAATRDQASR